MVINSGEKSPFEIRDSTGKEFKEIYDNQGRLLFKNWNEIQGSLPLTFKSYADYLKDYRIYGNTVQNGTPAPDNPVDVVGCGEYDAELNGYKIPVTVSNGTNSVITPVYVGSEPLHKIGDYADYVDFKRGVVVRKIKKLVLTGNEDYGVYEPQYSRVIFYVLNAFSYGIRKMQCFCTHYQNMHNEEPIDDVPDKSVYINYVNGRSQFCIKEEAITSLSGFKSYFAAQYAAGTPVTIWYVLAEPEEEPLENLLPIQTIKGTNILTADTTVQPSEMYLKGKIKPAT